MKILVICQYYYPEPFRITDVCEELVKMGHEVTVLTGIPNYPEGKIYSGYGYMKKKEEIKNGVNIKRCFTIPRKKGVIYRFLNYYSFAVSSSIKVLLNKIKTKENKEFDIVFVNQLSPIMMAYAGMVYKKKYNKKLILYSLDLWPESLVTGGIKRESLIFKVFHKISKKIYQNCDQILVTSKMFIEYLSKEFHLEKDRIQYLPQYAEAIFKPEECIKKSSKTIDLMFAGNIGKAQNIETIIMAANECKDIKNLCWHILGEGSELENMKKLTEKLKLSSVIFYGRKPLSEMPKFYSMADAMLITMEKDPIISMTLPGKIQTYMAAGKLIIGAIDGEASLVIKEACCGYCGKAGDYKELSENIKKFIDNISKKEILESNSFLFYKKNFNKDTFFNKLFSSIKVSEIKGGKSFENINDK